jgi:hypothetical protein
LHIVGYSAETVSLPGGSLINYKTTKPVLALALPALYFTNLLVWVCYPAYDRDSTASFEVLKDNILLRMRFFIEVVIDN